MEEEEELLVNEEALSFDRVGRGAIDVRPIYQIFYKEKPIILKSGKSCWRQINHAKSAFTHYLSTFLRKNYIHDLWVNSITGDIVANIVDLPELKDITNYLISEEILVIKPIA